MNKMIPHALTNHEIHALCTELSPLILNATVIDCAASDSSRFLLVLQNGTQRRKLFFCFQKPFVCLYLAQSNEGFKSPHPLKPFLLSKTLQAINVVNGDRILAFSFEGMQYIVELFPKHPNYYLVNQSRQILLSLHPHKDPFYTPPAAHAYSVASLPCRSNQEIEQQYLAFLFDREKCLLESRLKQQLARQHTLIQKLQTTIDEAKNWEALQHEGELLKANYGLLKRGAKHIEVWDWLNERHATLELDPRLSPQESVTSRFKQSRKMLKSLPHLDEQLQKTQQAIEKTEAVLASLNRLDSLIELDRLKEKYLPAPPAEKQEKAPALPYYEYESADGTKIWVGKNAKNNEILTFQLAKGLDWWLHVKDLPGSHVIIRTPKGQEPDQETIQDALQLALHYSKAKQEGQAEICLTQKKFVSRLGSGHQVGRVQISKHKTIFTRLDAHRLKLLQERRRPNLHL